MKMLYLGAALTVLTFAQAAQAEQPIAEPLFSGSVVGDDVLAGLRGGQSPFAQLTAGSAGRMTDDQARADLRQTGSVGRIQMDVWWGTTGSELIAENVRAQGGG